MNHPQQQPQSEMHRQRFLVRNLQGCDKGAAIKATKLSWLSPLRHRRRVGRVSAGCCQQRLISAALEGQISSALKGHGFSRASQAAQN
jgi:hypothetical protein